jgi:predicted metalloprotease with PDZ domain
MGREISINIKFFSGIDKELKLKDYNPSEGVNITVSGRKRLRGVLKSMGADASAGYACFREGERISRWAKLRDGDEITCLKPAGGG